VPSFPEADPYRARSANHLSSGVHGFNATYGMGHIHRDHRVTLQNDNVRVIIAQSVRLLLARNSEAPPLAKTARKWGIGFHSMPEIGEAHQKPLTVTVTGALKMPPADAVIVMGEFV
jgi:hypothetical protein